jgi:hypothetical protein
MYVHMFIYIHTYQEVIAQQKVVFAALGNMYIYIYIYIYIYKYMYVWIGMDVCIYSCI